jgi:hypothetical protein
MATVPKVIFKESWRDWIYNHRPELLAIVGIGFFVSLIVIANLFL